MNFTCLIINFPHVLTFQQRATLERKRLREEWERKEQELKAEVHQEYKQCLAKYKNRPLFRLSLSSYFIPFVRGTWCTGLQRRLQWAHQSVPTDCGPTDTLEVGIIFLCWKCRKGEHKVGKWKQLLLFVICASFLIFHCCLSVVFLSELTHVEGAEGRASTLFLSDARFWRFPSVLLSSFLLSFSPALCLSLTLLTSTLWVQPTWLWAKINAHMCLQLLFIGLTKVRREKRKTDEQNESPRLRRKYSSDSAFVYQNNGRIINREKLSWLFLFFNSWAASGAFSGRWWMCCRQTNCGKASVQELKIITRRPSEGFMQTSIRWPLAAVAGSSVHRPPALNRQTRYWSQYRAALFSGGGGEDLFNWFLLNCK